MYLCAVNNTKPIIMPRQERQQSATGIYHVMLKGINKQDIFEEGYCQAESYVYNSSQDEFTFCYYDRDHLGNNREVVDASGTLQQRISYYPFGAPHADPNIIIAPSLQPYKYNGKEFDGMHGLNTYDYGARQYNPVTAHWDRVDPLAEKYYGISPYAYCANNPINSIDENGDSIIVDKYGCFLEQKGNDFKVYIMEQDNNKSYYYIGELGKIIDINTIYGNLLKKNASIAKYINPFKFKELVKTNSVWDLKNNKNTIYGIGALYKTKFVFQGKLMDAQDVGNHHFGVVSKANFFISEELALRKAGEYQIESGTSRPEWQKFIEIQVISPTTGTISYFRQSLPPYGDDPRDQFWIKRGFNYYNKHLKR